MSALKGAGHQPRRRGLHVLALSLWTSCATPSLSIPVAETPTTAETLSPPTESLTELSLFERWEDGPRMSFERELGAWNPSLSAHRLAPEDRRTLGASLSGLNEAAVRAALLLGHSRDPKAAEVLIARLEERVEGSDRNSDSADVVAAATLAAWPHEASFTARLAALSLTGSPPSEAPHPDLEVRVECASSALARGEESVVPFLLRVLRAGTPAQHEDPPDWTPKATMAWSKSRAATALSLHLDVAVRFRADASYDDQLREIGHLVSLLKANADG